MFFPATSSVSAARHWATPHLADRYPIGVVEDALLCISELAANAVQHARTAYEVRLSDGDDRLRISVVDDDVTLAPTPATLPGPDVATGRGLAIISAVCARHGTSIEGDRKVVWCELATG